MQPSPNSLVLLGWRRGPLYDIRSQITTVTTRPSELLLRSWPSGNGSDDGRFRGAIRRLSHTRGVFYRAGRGAASPSSTSSSSSRTRRAVVPGRLDASVMMAPSSGRISRPSSAPRRPRVVAFAGRSRQLLFFQPRHGRRVGRRYARRGRHSVSAAVPIVNGLRRRSFSGSQKQVDPGGSLFSEDPDGVQKKGPMVHGDDPDGVQVFRTDPFDRLQIVVAMVDKVGRVMAQLQKVKPLHHNVGLVIVLGARPRSVSGHGSRPAGRGRRRNGGRGHSFTFYFYSGDFPPKRRKRVTFNETFRNENYSLHLSNGVASSCFPRTLR